jgi:chromosomal replication initiation ATPase DnaA
MDAEAEISRKEQLQRDTRACANLLRRLLRFHPDHAPTHMRKPADPAAAAPGSTGTGGTIAAIIRVASAYYGIAVEDIVARGRGGAAVIEARQVAIYLARQLTTRSLAEIARCFGPRDHTTILHAVRQVERRRQHDPDLGLVLHYLAAKIKSRKQRAA